MISGMTSVVIVGVGEGCGTDAKTRKSRRPGAFPSIDNGTVVVIVACFLFGFYLFIVDSGLAWLVDRIFKATGVIGA